MARIAGVDLPRDKRVEIGLTYIYGIGPTLASEIIAKTGINPDTRVRDLSEDEVAKMLFLMKITKLKVTFVVKKLLTLNA